MQFDDLDISLIILAIQHERAQIKMELDHPNTTPDRKIILEAISQKYQVLLLKLTH